MTHSNDTRPGPNPSGLCMCGCGQPTALAKRSDARTGAVKGSPKCLIPGHQPRNIHKYTEDPETKCWNWYGANDGSGGYGTIREQRGRRRLLAHRVIYEYFKGPIPEGLVLDHLCQNRLCVNPDHLEPVTNSENIRRGRNSKITPEIATAIRGLKDLVSQRAIGELFGIDQATVSDIMVGKAWRSDATFSAPSKAIKRRNPAA